MVKQRVTREQETEVPIWMMQAKLLGRKIIREEAERQEREERLLTPSVRVLDDHAR